MPHTDVRSTAWQRCIHSNIARSLFTAIQVVIYAFYLVFNGYFITQSDKKTALKLRA